MKKTLVGVGLIVVAVVAIFAVVPFAEGNSDLVEWVVCLAAILANIGIAFVILSVFPVEPVQKAEKNREGGE